AIDHEAPDLVRRLFDLDQELINDPFAAYRQMREESPVLRINNLVAVARYGDVKDAMRDPVTFSSDSHRGTRVQRLRAGLSADETARLDDLVAHEGVFTRTDDPEHARLRRFVNHAFSAARIAEMREQIQDITGELLDEVDARDGNRLELIGDFAYKRPLRVITRLLGASGPETEMIRRWSEIIGVAVGTEYSNLNEASEALDGFKEYVAGLIARGRAVFTPTDLVGELVGKDHDGVYLTDVELTKMFVQLLFAGHETTTNLIAISIIALQENPDQSQILRDEPSLMRPAVDEFPRYCGSVHTVHRVASRECEIAGLPVFEGETVRLMLASANHDPEAFEDPDTLDVRRKNARSHVGLGFGIHTCLGQRLTRLEAEVALEALQSRYPRLALDGPWQKNRNLTLHGPARLDLTY
ncbi:MAG: cytochrome P450, partial [Mycetocola sp.]